MKKKLDRQWQFGTTGDLVVMNNFYLLTGLEFQTKGTKSKPKNSHK